MKKYAKKACLDASITKIIDDECSKPMTYIERSIYLSFIGITNKGQAELQKKHKDPYQYAIDVLANVPGFISIEEAKESIEKYNKEWTEAV